LNFCIPIIKVIEGIHNYTKESAKQDALEDHPDDPVKRSETEKLLIDFRLSKHNYFRCDDELRELVTNIYLACGLPIIPSKSYGTDGRRVLHQLMCAYYMFLLGGRNTLRINNHAATENYVRRVVGLWTVERVSEHSHIRKWRRGHRGKQIHTSSYIVKFYNIRTIFRCCWARSRNKSEGDLRILCKDVVGLIVSYL
jgi:hypothetical protein